MQTVGEFLVALEEQRKKLGLDVQSFQHLGIVFELVGKTGFESYMSGGGETLEAKDVSMPSPYDVVVAIGRV